MTKISKKKPGARKPGNPFLDATFNLNRFANEKGMRPDDIAERTGIPTNKHIEIQTIEGMTFLKLDDTPDEYTVSKYLRVNEDADAIIFDDLDVEVFWAKGSECIYYKDRNVAVGKTTADYTLDVEGTVRATTALLSDAHVTAGSYVKADTYVDATTYYKFGGNNLLWIEDDNNIIFGESALAGDNLTGINFSNSIIAGHQVGYNLEWSTGSVILGYQAVYRGGGVQRGVILGPYAGMCHASAVSDDFYGTVAIGDAAGADGSGDLGGIYVGDGAGQYLAYAQDRICIGRAAGRGHAASGYSSCDYSYGIFIGASAGGRAVNITGDCDIGIGKDALYSVTSSAHSIALGRNSLYLVTEGSGNIGIGGYAGNTLTTGTYNILLGYDADTDGVDYTNSIGIAYQAAVTKSNQIVLGNSSHTEFKMPMFGAGSLQSDADGVVTASGSLGLGDPGADRIAFWDDSESCLAWLTPGTGLSITTTSLNVDVGIADDDIVQVDGSPADDEYAKWTANGLEGRTYANVLADLSGQAGAAFDWNSQDLTSIGDIQVGDGKYVGVSGDVRIEYDSTNHYLEVKGGDFFTDRWLSQDTNTFFGVNVASAGNLANTAGTEGYSNTAFGSACLRDITTGKQNVAVGANALRELTEGKYNIGIGANALINLIDGDHNFGLGREALYTITTGASNTAIGSEAMKISRTGASHCVAIGYKALGSNANYSGNVAIGSEALRLVEYTAWLEGYQNIGIGQNAGDNITTGNYNVIIGNDLDAKSATNDYQLSIGDIYRGHINDGEAYIACPATICGDADLANNEVSFAVDETNDELDIKVKYSTGVVKSGTVALA